MTSTPQPLAIPDSARRRWFAGMAALGGIGLLAASGPSNAWGRRGDLDPEERLRRLDYRMDRLVREVGGTPAQKERLVAIASAAMTELQPIRQQRRAARVQGLDLLAAPVIDRRALEQARVTQMQAADAASRRMSQAMADAAEVFTPEQRVKVTEHLKKRMARRRG
jgi:protein CpxP